MKGGKGWHGPMATFGFNIRFGVDLKRPAR
jgi:hypothetical protein